MKIIVAGSRNFNDYEFLKHELDIINKEGNISYIVCGKAKGADSLGEKYALENNIEVIYFEPEWNLYGKRAGHIRNELMGNYADTLIAFWDNKSKGTKHMINYMKKINKKYIVKIYTNKEIIDIGEW